MGSKNSGSAAAKREAERLRKEEKQRLADEAKKKEQQLQNLRDSAAQEQKRKYAGDSFLGEDDENLGSKTTLGGQ